MVPAYSIIGLAVLVAAGGIIAWLGDIIGYRLGKRRSTLFGLRPRTTARLVGIAVGASLPLIGVAVAALGSSYVQDALFRIQYLRNQQQLLTEQVDELNRDVSQAEAEAASARTEARRARQQATALKGETQTLHKQAATLNQRITSLQAERDDLVAKAQRIHEDLDEAKSRLEQSKDELAQVHTDKEALQRQRESLKADVDTLEGQLSSTQGQLAVVRRELEDKMRELEPVQQELELKLDRLAELQVELEDLHVELEDLHQVVQGWKQAVYGPVLFEASYELVRNIIGSAQTEQQIESSLQEILVLASKTVSVRGLRFEAGPSVQLLAPIPEGKRLGEVSEERIITAVGRRIRQGEEESYVVSAKVLATVFAAQPELEPVPVMLVLIPNSRVYRQGETIVRMQIDGSRSRDQVFAQVWSILTQLRREAQQQGILPHPETGQYGDVPAEQLLSALDELLAGGQPQPVEAVAAEDVYRAGLSPFLVAIRVGADAES